MDKQKVIDYVMETPENSNPNVLKTMLEDSGGGDSDIEIITLGTSEITFYKDRNYAQGTCYFTDDKSLTEILNGKKIIEYYAEVTIGTGSGNNQSGWITLRWLGQSSYGDIRTMQSTGWADSAKSCGMFFTGIQNATSDYTYNVTIYIVCK